MNYSEFLDLVVRLLTRNAPANSVLTAAALGGLLHQAAPEVKLKKFGKSSLLDVLRDLEASGHIRLTQTTKGALAVTPTGSVETVSAPQIESFNPLRKAIWEGFVFTAPAGRRYMHRLSGIIRAGLDMAPTPADEWIELTPLSSDVQRQWAIDFLSQIDPEKLKATRQQVSNSPWHPQQFAKVMREEDESAARSWNRYRSSKVSAVVQHWLSENNIPTEFAFQQHGQILIDGTSEPKELGLIQAKSRDETKQLILRALAEMPLERLLEIPIPAGILLSALLSGKAH